MLPDAVELLLQDSCKKRLSKKKPKNEANKENVNLQDIFNTIKKNPGKKAPSLSPKSKRAAAWDLEDDESSKDEEDPSFPDCCLCLVCNTQMQTEQEAHQHILKTFHKNFEMVTQNFHEEFSQSD